MTFVAEYAEYAEMKGWFRGRWKLIGREVILKGKVYKIVGTYMDIVGGVILDKSVDGCVSWNLDALRIIP